MRLNPAEARRLAEMADHGVLGTHRVGSSPDLVPVVFAIVGDLLAIPIDTVKPKASADLQRTRNLGTDPRATLLVERWDGEDWSRLWWVRLRLVRTHAAPADRAELERVLRLRYPPYEGDAFTELLVFEIVEVMGWSASPLTG